MRESLRTTLSQFSSYGGRPQARASNVRAVEPAADLPGAERGNLYVLVEVTGSGGSHAALYRQILNATQTAFYEARGATTAALMRAISGAHAALVRANEALPEANWRAGITCAALQGWELTIAQAGPALAWVSHPRTVDQFPAVVGPAGAPLGGPERPEIQLFQTDMEPGSMLLLAQSDWLSHVAPESLAAAAAAESVALASDYLAQLAGDADLSALLVGLSTSSGSAEAERPTVVAEHLPGPAPAVLPESAAAEAGAAVGGGMTAVGRLVQTIRSLGSRAPASAAHHEAEPDTISQHGEEGRAEAAMHPGPVAPQRAKPESVLRRGEARGRRQEARALVEPWDDSSAEAQGSVAEAPTRRSAWPLILALGVVPVIIALVVLSMLWFRTRAAETQFQQTLSGAEAAIVDADKQSDPTMARSRLGAAKEFIDTARTLRPADAALAKLQVRYIEVLDRVNQVVPLYGVMPLWEFKETGRRLERVVVGGDSLFVLDRGRNEVYHFVLSAPRDNVTLAETPTILRKGDPVGDLVVSDLVDMAWMEAVGNQRSRLLVLDAAGGLVSFDVTRKASRVPIVGREQWGLPQLLGTYGGNLYIVDTKANQVWRYRQSDKGFENPVERYFSADTVVDMAAVQSIVIDGSIWLLMADGRLLKFYLGESKPFEVKGLPDKMRAPTALTTLVDSTQVYVADAGNGRIIELSKEGKFLRQFRPSQGEIPNIRDVFLDEAGGRFYIFTADRLYKANLPKLAVPTATPASTPTPTPTPPR